MGKNYLLIVEGEKAEPAIFDSLLTRYGYHVVRRDRLTEYEGIVLDNIELQSGADNVLIAQGPKNRIKELLSLYRREFIDFDKLFGRNVIGNHRRPDPCEFTLSGDHVRAGAT